MFGIQFSRVKLVQLIFRLLKMILGMMWYDLFIFEENYGSQWLLNFYYQRDNIRGAR